MVPGCTTIPIKSIGKLMLVSARLPAICWNYASRLSVASLHRSVIMMLPVISKNLMFAAYIRPGAWVACKVSRTVQTGSSVFAGHGACNPGACGGRGCVAVVPSIGAFATLGLRARVPRR